MDAERIRYVENPLVSTSSASQVGFSYHMEPVLLEFGLKPDVFRQVVQNTGAMIAGSAVTAALTNSFTPNDLDVWVRLETDERSVEEGVVDMERRSLDKATNFLRTITLIDALKGAGYKHDWKPPSHHYYGGMATPLIHEIRNFINGDGKKVQLIFTKVPLSKVLDDFDLDVCCCWWLGGPHIYARYPGALVRREVSLTDSHEPDLEMLEIDEDLVHRRIARIRKYLVRGFKPSLRLKAALEGVGAVLPSALTSSKLVEEAPSKDTVVKLTVMEATASGAGAGASGCSCGWGAH